MAYENWWLGMAFGSSPNEPFPTWTDVTSSVEAFNAYITATTGEDSEATSDTGSMSWQLNNSDQSFTPGNVNSPYYPNVKSGVQVWLRETIGTRTFDIFRGYLAWPEIESWASSTADAPRDQTITVTAVDRLTRLGMADQFVSTLAEYIRYNGGTALVAHWPMSDAGVPFDSLVSSPLLARTSVQTINYGDFTEQAGSATCTPASAAGPAGEDVSFAEYDMDLRTVGGLLRPARSIITSALIPDGLLTLSAGQVMTVVAWVRSDWRATDTESWPLNILFTDPAVGALTLYRQDGADATWLLEVAGATALSASFVGPIAPADRWTLVAMRLGFTPATAELWVDDEQTVGTLSGVAPSLLTVTDVRMPDGNFAGSLAQVQIYIGAEADYTFAQFQAQRAAGLTGLEYQTTGERIRTILQYAGVPDGELGEIGDGQSYMQRAELAGQTPAAAMAVAAETEQGRLYVSGSGRVVFDDRRTIYTV